MLKKIILYLLFLSVFTPTWLLAFNSEIDLKAVFIGRFSKFITWPESDRDKFIITVIDTNPFDSKLDKLYKNKKIHNKSIKIRYVTSIDDIKESDILFITIKNPKEVKKVLKYARENSILTVSDAKGFAQRGGIIQIDFVMRKIKLKINNEASKEAKIKISSSLLNISEVIKGGKNWKILN